MTFTLGEPLGIMEDASWNGVLSLPCRNLSSLSRRNLYHKVTDSSTYFEIRTFSIGTGTSLRWHSKYSAKRTVVVVVDWVCVTSLDSLQKEKSMLSYWALVVGPTARQFSWWPWYSSLHKRTTVSTNQIANFDEVAESITLLVIIACVLDGAKLHWALSRFCHQTLRATSKVERRIE
jgi:hypothetical protein